MLGWDGCEGSRWLDSSVSTGSAAGHGSASKIVIMVQSFVILSLSLWFVEEYLNNKYLGEYLNGVFQADGLIIGTLGTLLILGSVSTAMFVSRRHSEKRFGAVSLEVTSPSVASTPKTKLVAEPSKNQPEAFAKPSMDFHPVVAALKADMADRRSSFGSLTGAGAEQPIAVPVPKTEVRPTSVLEQLTPNRQPPVTGPRPGQMGAPFAQQPFRDLRPQAPTGPSVQQGGALLAQRPMPLFKPQEPAGSTVLQPPQPPTPQIPTNVTTVITGIMPAQKKKDPTATTEEKSSTSQ